IAAIFITFLIAYPATAPNRNPPPAENRKSSTGNSEVSTPCQLWHTILFEVLNLICDRHFYVRFILYQTANLYTIPYSDLVVAPIRKLQFHVLPFCQVH